VLRPCLYPGCGELVPDGYCTRHDTGDSSARGYGHRWAEVSRAYRRAHPRCERCQRRPSKIVHHVDGLGPHGPRGYDPTNLEAVCRKCHGELHSTRGSLAGGRGPTPTTPAPRHPRHPHPSPTG
jgi:5-methylcytosine-specific restriction protein A